jgi:four helix bundle protein
MFNAQCSVLTTFRMEAAMQQPDIQTRSFEFACRVIRLVESVSRRSSTTRLLCRQLLRSSTSVGANLEEASGAQSKADFVSKCSIATKDARETKYWLRLLAVSRSTESEDLAPLLQEADELVAILTTIVRNAEQSENRSRREVPRTSEPQN